MLSLSITFEILNQIYNFITILCICLKFILCTYITLFYRLVWPSLFFFLINICWSSFCFFYNFIKINHVNDKYLPSWQLHVVELLHVDLQFVLNVSYIAKISRHLLLCALRSCFLECSWCCSCVPYTLVKSLYWEGVRSIG